MPAAVISIGKNLGRRSAASSTALYPETVACEDSASIGCARVIRGIDSSANPVTPRRVRRSMPSGSVSGWRNAIRIEPSASRSTSSADGFCTFTTPSASAKSSSRLTTPAPASRYSESEKLAASPAPCSTATSNPPAASFSTISGTSATRRSPTAVSFGTATLTGGGILRGALERATRCAGCAVARHRGRGPVHTRGHSARVRVIADVIARSRVGGAWPRSSPAAWAESDCAEIRTAKCK